MGVLLGLLPKTNLLAVLIALLLFLSYANLLVGAATTVIVSLIAPWIHPIAHDIGGEILTSAVGQQIGGALFRIPLVPWTFLDNTVVLGSFLLGLVLLLPVFCVVWIAARIAGLGKKKEKEDGSQKHPV